jgi:hypothetical protein
VELHEGQVVSSGYRNENCYQSEANPFVWCASANERDEFDAQQIARVYEYHQTTAIDAHGGWPTVTPRAALCFGVELEMEHVNVDGAKEEQEELSDALGGRDGGTRHGAGRYILMNDGSLNSSGVELITCPYTLEFHQREFGWSNLLGYVSSIAKSGKETANCGMHVHVNRRALSPLTLGKMLVFVNADSTTRLIETIAQRDPSRWAKRYEKRIVNGADATSDKYEALHLAGKTVEFRIFRGNLRPDRVLKNIEFCHAVTMYCKDASMQELGNPALFVAWLAKRKASYPNLAKFLSEKSFMSRLGRAANAQSDARPSTAIISEEL